MKTFECSTETPWGLHLSLLGEHCPRCGWEAPRPTPRSWTAEPEFGATPFGAMVATGMPAQPSA